MFDWRAKLKEEEKDNDPKNMWKKFDSAGPMKAIYQYIDKLISATKFLADPPVPKF